MSSSHNDVASMLYAYAREQLRAGHDHTAIIRSLINQNFDPELVVAVVQRARTDALAAEEQEQQQRRHMWLRQRITQLIGANLSNAQIEQQLMSEGVPRGVASDAIHSIRANTRVQHTAVSASGAAGGTSPHSRNRLVLFGLGGLLLVALGYGINTVVNAPSDQDVAAGTTSPAGVTLPTFTPSVSSTSTPRPTATLTPPRLAVVQIDTLNVRELPGIQYEPPLTQVSSGDELTVLGRAPDLKWIKVRLPDTEEGWVSAKPEHVRLNVDLDQLPSIYFRPSTGLVSSAEQLIGNGSLEIDNDAENDSAVIVALSKEQPLVAAYIRRGETFTIEGIPDGEYIVYTATGNEWGGAKFQDGQLERFEKTVPFFTTADTLPGWEIGLLPSRDGNAPVEGVAEDDFPQINPNNISEEP